MQLRHSSLMLTFSAFGPCVIPLASNWVIKLIYGDLQLERQQLELFQNAKCGCCWGLGYLGKQPAKTKYLPNWSLGCLASTEIKGDWMYVVTVDHNKMFFPDRENTSFISVQKMLHFTSVCTRLANVTLTIQGPQNRSGVVHSEHL